MHSVQCYIKLPVIKYGSKRSLTVSENICNHDIEEIVVETDETSSSSFFSGNLILGAFGIQRLKRAVKQVKGKQTKV